jgi:hypothetical protein
MYGKVSNLLMHIAVGRQMIVRKVPVHRGSEVQVSSS